MKRMQAVVIALLLGSLSALVWAGLAHAQSFHAGGDTTVSRDQMVDGTLYSVGHTITISGTVNGDVLCAGQTIDISGTVNGDVLCAGQSIDISGTVNGSVRLAGQTVDISGSVGRSASVAAQTFTTHTTTKIQGDISFVASTTTLNGSVGRDVSGAGANMTIAGNIGRNLKATTPELTFTSGARVNGNANYISNNNATVDGGAIVPHLTHSIPAQPSRHHLAGAVFGFGIGWFVYILIASLLTSLVLVLLFPRFFHDVSEQAVKNLGLSILTGFLAGIAVFVLFIALLITFVGWPLAALMLMAWFLIVALSLPICSYYLGSMILSKAKHPVPPILLGTAILVILFFLPIVGLIIAAVAVWIGAGSLLRYLRSRWPKPSYKL